MKRSVKWLFVGALSVGLLAGCTEKEKEETPPSTEAQEIKWTATLEQAEDRNGFVYTVINQTKEAVTYTFKSGMQIDYTLYKDGQKQYTQSEVASFTQSLTEVTLTPNEEKTYEIVLEDLTSGNYQLDVWFTAKEQYDNTKESINFVVD